MRKILFRGKRTDNNEWIEGCLLLTNCKSYISNRPYSMGKVYEADGIEFVFGGFYEVDPATVGQCTGLIDKNGNKIFEGDILEVHDEIPLFDGYNSEEICYNSKVMYIDNQGMYVCEGNENGNALCALNLDECEVIGNVHDGGAYD